VNYNFQTDYIRHFGS